MNGPELRDIHLPDASLWWPPAPGWWLLPLLLLLAVLGLRWLWLRRRRLPLRRQALRELERIRADAARGVDDKTCVAALAALLRRTLISCRGREGYAASSGDDWCRQLQSIAPAHCFDAAQLNLLARERYRRDAAYELEPLFSACECWLRALPRKVDHAAA